MALCPGYSLNSVALAPSGDWLWLLPGNSGILEVKGKTLPLGESWILSLKYSQEGSINNVFYITYTDMNFVKRAIFARQKAFQDGYCFTKMAHKE